VPGYLELPDRDRPEFRSEPVHHVEREGLRFRGRGRGCADVRWQRAAVYPLQLEMRCDQEAFLTTTMDAT